MSSAAVSVDYIIVSYNSATVIDQCLDAIEAAVDALPSPASIIAIDNHSNDDSVARLAARNIGATPSGGNRGFAVAANLGAQQAGAEVLCFLNPDCMITPTVVEQALSALHANPRCVAVPTFRHADAAIVAGRQPGYSRRKLLADLLETAGAARSAATLKRVFGVDNPRWHWPLGACLFVRRDFFNTMGGFDESFFMYMEDVQFGLSVHQAGGQVVALDSVIDHLSGQGSAVSMARRLGLLDQARIQFARRHYGSGFAALLGGIRRAGLRATARRA